MLIGSYFSALSPKRRAAIPKKFLNQLGSKIIIAKWYEGCLVIVSEAGWKALLKRLTGKTQVVTASVRDTDRFIMASAYELEPDFQGRVVIPTSLVDYAKLGSQLVFLGLGERVEVWDKSFWSEREKFVQKHASEMLEKIARETRKEGNKN